MRHGLMVKSLLLSPKSQVAISGSLVSVIFCTRPPFNSYSIVAVAGAVQGCEEIKAITAFSFLLWILCSYFSFERLCVSLTV